MKLLISASSSVLGHWAHRLVVGSSGSFKLQIMCYSKNVLWAIFSYCSAIQRTHTYDIKTDKVDQTRWQFFVMGLSWWIWKQRKAANAKRFSPSVNNKMKQLWFDLRQVPDCCHWVADQQRQSACHFSFIEWIYARDCQSRLIVGLVFSTGYSRLWHILEGFTQPIARPC